MHADEYADAWHAAPFAQLHHFDLRIATFKFLATIPDPLPLGVRDGKAPDLCRPQLVHCWPPNRIGVAGSAITAATIARRKSSRSEFVVDSRAREFGSRPTLPLA